MELWQLQKWYQMPPGNWLLQLEQEQLRKWLPLMRGANIVQLGGLPDFFQEIKGQNDYYCFLSQYQQEAGEHAVDVIAQFDELPFLPNSVDLVLLIHVLEYVDHPTVVLKEVFDILTPNGKLLLFCFNPWSLWGIQKLLNGNKSFPWTGKFISTACLQNWLISLGYTNIKDKTLCFRSAYKRCSLTRFTFFVEALGQITLPMLGAVNVFLVEKRVYGALKKTRYQWQKKRTLNSSIIEQPTTFYGN